MADGKVEDLRGIRGWLILIVIGLVFSPLRIGLMLQKDFLPLFSDGTWEVLTSPSSEVYHRLWGPLIAFEIVGNLTTITLALFTLYFLFKRSRHTPKIAIAWLLIGLVFVVSDFFFAQMIPAIADQPADPETSREITRSIVGAAIWVPYFLISKRVKATFIE